MIRLMSAFRRLAMELGSYNSKGFGEMRHYDLFDKNDALTDTRILLIFKCEGRSFRFTPHVRYGREPLCQALQLHSYQLSTWSHP